MKFKLQLVAIGDGTVEPVIHELAEIEKDCDGVEKVGLTLLESKEILRELQRHVVEHQAEMFLRRFARCDECGSHREIKGHHRVVFRTLFGKLSMNSPRFRHCRCGTHETATFSPLTELFSERTAPELLFLETKWASLVSYGLTVKALREFLPIDEKANASTVRNHALGVAKRCEAQLGDERVFFIDGCPRDWNDLPPAEGPITVGIDGGYLRNWNEKKTNFEVIVGKSVPTDRPAKCFGLVQNHDKKPKSRLFELLSSQGMQMNQDIYFMSDGEKTVRELQLYLNPRAKHMLDWFHITMRLTVLEQCLKGLRHAKLPEDDDLPPHVAASIVPDMEHALEKTKWNLWNGRPERALEWFDDIEDLMWNFADTYPKFKALKKLVEEFRRYIERNGHMIQNYGERWRKGLVISTAFVESLVNSLLGKRFTKKQQMQWTHEGAHLLLQTRTKTINHELGEVFRRWYPAFVDGQAEPELAQAA